MNRLHSKRNRTLASTWIPAIRRKLTPWVLAAILLMSGGCRGMTANCFRFLSNPRVCPTCTAHSVDQCHCFSVAENAGYCETTWASLDPLMSQSPYNTAEYSEVVEELIVPEVPLAPAVGHSGSASVEPFEAVGPLEPATHLAEPAELFETADILQSTTNLQVQTQSLTGNGEQAASARIVDESLDESLDVPLDEYFRQ